MRVLSLHPQQSIQCFLSRICGRWTLWSRYLLLLAWSWYILLSLRNIWLLLWLLRLLLIWILFILRWIRLIWVHILIISFIWFLVTPWISMLRNEVEILWVSLMRMSPLILSCSPLLLGSFPSCSWRFLLSRIRIIIIIWIVAMVVPLGRCLNFALIQIGRTCVDGGSGHLGGPSRVCWRHMRSSLRSLPWPRRWYNKAWDNLVDVATLAITGERYESQWDGWTMIDENPAPLRI